MKSLLILAAIIMGFVSGFVIGLQHHDIKRGKLDKTWCNQYTVIDADSVLTACGERKKYNWKTHRK